MIDWNMKPSKPKRPLFDTGEALGELLLKPFQRFSSMQAAGGALLFFLTIVALIWSNSDFADSYDWLKHFNLDLRIGSFSLGHSLHFWINDGLMTFFFFMVGLEIKREFLIGELSSLRQASLPLFGAVGGMVFPASIYYMLNAQTPSANGWAIPMATDIAFTMAALTLLGSKVPHPLKVFVTALAIVDDIGAVTVIAIFYSSDLSTNYLLLASFLVIVLICFNLLGYRKPLPYVVVGLFVWLAIYMSGIHSTIAGILVAFTIPARTRRDMAHFLDRLTGIVNRLKPLETSDTRNNGEENRQAIVNKIEDLCKDVQTPLQRMEESLNPWVVFVIVPLFALVNAGVSVNSSDILKILSAPVGLGVVMGLLIGKQFGISVACWIAIRMRFAELPSGVKFSQIYGASIICGIGFTMSIFVADLAFGQSINLDYAKISILVGSVLSFLLGLLIIAFVSPQKTDLDVEQPE